MRLVDTRTRWVFCYLVLPLVARGVILELGAEGEHVFPATVLVGAAAGVTAYRSRLPWVRVAFYTVAAMWMFLIILYGLLFAQLFLCGCETDCF